MKAQRKPVQVSENRDSQLPRSILADAFEHGVPEIVEHDEREARAGEGQDKPDRQRSSGLHARLHPIDRLREQETHRQLNRLGQNDEERSKHNPKSLPGIVARPEKRNEPAQRN